MSRNATLTLAALFLALLVIPVTWVSAACVSCPGGGGSGTCTNPCGVVTANPGTATICQSDGTDCSSAACANMDYVQATGQVCYTQTIPPPTGCVCFPGTLRTFLVCEVWEECAGQQSACTSCQTVQIACSGGCVNLPAFQCASTVGPPSQWQHKMSVQDITGSNCSCPSGCASGCGAGALCTTPAQASSCCISLP